MKTVVRVAPGWAALAYVVLAGPAKAADPDPGVDCADCVERGRGAFVGGDLTTARALFERACKAGDRVGCQDLAVMLLEGLGGQPDPGRAVALLKNVCAADQPDACRNLGVILVEGRGVPADEVSGAAALRRACEAGDPAACGLYGVARYDGRGVPRSSRAARPHLERGCAADVFMACDRLARLHQEGRGGAPRDPARGLALIEAACASPRGHQPDRAEWCQGWHAERARQQSREAVLRPTGP